LLIDQASELWKDLHYRFSHGDVFQISELQEDIYHLQQGKLAVSEFFNQLKPLWDELENFRLLQPCKCAIPCTCTAVNSIESYNVARECWKNCN